VWLCGSIRSFVLHVVLCGEACRHVFCPHGTTRLIPDRFSWSLIFEYFSRVCRENSSFIKIWQELCVLYCTVLYCTVLYCTVLYCTVLYCTVLYMKTNTHVYHISLVFLRMRNISDKSCIENQNTYFVINNFFFFAKILLFTRYCGKIL
jgi:hypothetical protein